MAKFLDAEGVEDLLLKLLGRSGSAVEGTVTLAEGIGGTASLKKSASGVVSLTADLSSTVAVTTDMLLGNLPEGFRPTANVYGSYMAIWADFNVSSLFVRIEPDGNIYGSGYYTWGGAETNAINSCYINLSFIV
jgi:hypothetical protein